MTAENLQITDCHQADILSNLEALHQDMRQIYGMLASQGRDVAALKAELDSFAPVLDQFRQGVTLAGMRRAGKVRRLSVADLGYPGAAP